MSTVPSPVNSPSVQVRAGLAVVRQHDRQVVDVHPAVQSRRRESDGVRRSPLPGHCLSAPNTTGRSQRRKSRP